MYTTSIIEQIINNFDFAYMITINVLTYLVIKFIDFINGKLPVKTLTKRIVLVICTIACCIVYKLTTEISNQILINSTVLAPVAYSWIFKPMLKKLKIGYRTSDEI